jgi:hypothetical protein
MFRNRLSASLCGVPYDIQDLPLLLRCKFKTVEPSLLKLSYHGLRCSYRFPYFGSCIYDTGRTFLAQQKRGNQTLQPRPSGFSAAIDSKTVLHIKKNSLGI